MDEMLLLGVLAMLTATVGVIGGLGGAVLFVPILTLSGVPPVEAAPFGMLMVAAGSLGAGAPELKEGLLNHRLGVTSELGASLGVLVGVLLSVRLEPRVLTWVLAGTALLAAAAGNLRSGLRNLPDSEAPDRIVGELPGRLAGAYRLKGQIVPYEARRVAFGLAVLTSVGVVAGMTGTSGGYLKTPILNEVMHVPAKVAAATVTFTVGITAAAGLLGYASQGRLDVQTGAAVVVGGLLGGRLGGAGQALVSPVMARRVLGATLVAIAILLVTW